MNYDNIDIAEDTFDIDFNCSYVNNCPTIQEIDKFQTYFDSFNYTYELSLLTIEPIDDRAYQPLSLSTIEPIDH